MIKLNYYQNKENDNNNDNNLPQQQTKRHARPASGAPTGCNSFHLDIIMLNTCSFVCGTTKELQLQATFQLRTWNSLNDNNNNDDDATN